MKTPSFILHPLESGVESHESPNSLLFFFYSDPKCCKRGDFTECSHVSQMSWASGGAMTNSVGPLCHRAQGSAEDTRAKLSRHRLAQPLYWPGALLAPSSHSSIPVLSNVPLLSLRLGRSLRYLLFACEQGAILLPASRRR